MCLELVRSWERYAGVTRGPVSFLGCSAAPLRGGPSTPGGLVLEPRTAGCQGWWNETRCIEHVKPKRAFEMNFHLENSKGVHGLCVEWNTGGRKRERKASGQAREPSGIRCSGPPSQGCQAAMCFPLF